MNGMKASTLLLLLLILCSISTVYSFAVRKYDHQYVASTGFGCQFNCKNILGLSPLECDEICADEVQEPIDGTPSPTIFRYVVLYYMYVYSDVVGRYFD